MKKTLGKEEINDEKVPLSFSCRFSISMESCWKLLEKVFYSILIRFTYDLVILKTHTQSVCKAFIKSFPKSPTNYPLIH